MKRHSPTALTGLSGGGFAAHNGRSKGFAISALALMAFSYAFAHSQKRASKA
ncbi:MAG: hypothetical protein CPSOU_2245 [uncultured Paraburkholderia sp.]|nr:MAG: hypothetical protein CPSOU_2245 [uncultured Paraburkholderia sp.]